MQKSVCFHGRVNLTVVALATFLSVISVRAENNSNYVFNGTTTNFGGALYIPFTSSGTNNSLQILNGGSVTNTSGGVGVNGGDNYNYAIVSDPGSSWYSSGNYSIGSVGSYNYLLVTNSGYARMAGDVYVGSTGSSSNRVVVTDGGSLWSIGGRLHAGYAGTAASLIITNGGTVTALQTWEGGWPGSGKHSVLVTGPGSVLSNSLDFSIGVYDGSGSNQVMVSNGGRVMGATTAIGAAPGGGTNVVTITGSGSVWSNTSAFYLGGGSSAANQLFVQSGGTVRSDYGIFLGYTGPDNKALVTDAGSLIDTPSLQVGVYSANNRLTISNQAHAVAANAYLGSGQGGGSNNVLLVTGSGSVMSNSTATYVGYTAGSNKLIIANGGRVESGIAYMSYYLAPGNNWYGINNAAEVTGSGSVWNVAGLFRMNEQGYGSQLVITNGGRVNVGGQMTVGYGNSNAEVVVTGPGSMLHVDYFITVGNNGVYSVGNNSHLLITDGGTLETWNMLGGSSASQGSISNIGGVYQFTSNTVYVTPYGTGTIMMKDATVSYRDVTAADINNVYVGFISKQGNNTFQLNNSTNASLASYTFNTGNPSNYYRLALVNGGSRWQTTGGTTIGTGGQLLVSNSSAASVSGVVSNAGTIEVVNSKVTYEGAVTVSGLYRSDPSTNTFNQDLTVTTGGAMMGGVGDLFDFKKSFLIHSTNNTGFNLGAASVQFSGGGMHTNAITGQDVGTNVAGFVQNFAYGELHLGSSADQICFTCGNIPAIASNGLYVTWLDLLGDANLVTNLHAASGISIYYDKTDLRNAYLGGLTYGLTDCNFNPGGGSLVAMIPEPSTLLMLAMAALAAVRRNRNRE